MSTIETRPAPQSNAIAANWYGGRHAELPDTRHPASDTHLTSEVRPAISDTLRDLIEAVRRSAAAFFRLGLGGVVIAMVFTFGAAGLLGVLLSMAT